MSQAQAELLPNSPADPKLPQLPRPEKLRRVCSISSGLSARDLVGLLRENDVTAFLDTRVNRSYRGRGIATEEDDLRLLLELAGIQYFVVESLMPTHEMRSEFAEVFKDVKNTNERDPSAWTRFLEQYEQTLVHRRPLRTHQLQTLLYGEHRSIAVSCACRHHDDCHRSYACGMLSTLLPDVELRILYPDGRAPAPSSPRRYRLKAFPWANLPPNGPIKRRTS